MSSKVISVNSSQHFRSIVSSSTFVVVDFYATWCGPCKVISPVFEQLANAESKPGRLAFAKVDVDSQKDVATMYGVSAMPTFLVLRGTKVVETIRGANASALRSAVLSAAADAARGPAASGPSFSGKGQTLGGEGASSKSPTASLPSFNVQSLFSGPASFAQGGGVVQTLLRFVGLYVSTLFSFDPVKSAEESSFAVRRNNVRTRY